MIQKTFFFLLHKAESIAVHIFLFLVSPEWVTFGWRVSIFFFIEEQVKLTTACGLDYIHQSCWILWCFQKSLRFKHIFGKMNCHLFHMLVSSLFTSQKFWSHLLSSYTRRCTLLFIILLWNRCLWKKLSRKVLSTSTSKVSCHKMMLMIRWASRYPGRFCEERECDVFRSFFIFQALLQNPCDKKQHCHLHCTDVLVERGFQRVQSFYLHQKMEYFLQMNFSLSCLLVMLRFCCRNWSCKSNESDADWVSSESKYPL